MDQGKLFISDVVFDYHDLYLSLSFNYWTKPPLRQIMWCVEEKPACRVTITKTHTMYRFLHQ